jgi:methyl-accepting chemotaxis protein
MGGEMKMNLKTKIILVMACFGILPMAIVGMLAYYIAEKSLTEKISDSLRIANSLKHAQLERFFSERKGDIEVLAQRNALIDKAVVLNEVRRKAEAEGFTGLKLLQNPAYKEKYDDLYGDLKGMVDVYGYYDVIFISPEDGYVFFTHGKEADMGSNLATAGTALTRLWKDLQNSASRTLVTDTEAYAPSNGEPAQFVGTTLIKDNKPVAIVALQIPLKSINAITGNREGMGKTGESYLVGYDRLMRSDSFLNPKEHSVSNSLKNKVMVDTVSVRDAFAGQTGVKAIKDYNNNLVLSAYASIDIGNGIKWALLSEIDDSEGLAAVYTMRNIILAIIAISIGVVLFGGYFFGSSIANPIISLSNEMKVAAGQVSTASEQVSAAGQQIAESTTEQAASLEEITASIEEINSMTRLNADNAKEAKQLSVSAREVAEKGEVETKRLIQSMIEISASSKKIEEIINVIDNIAFQTNLLALNAAVEAARAGEQGKGFAVVAEAVRELAQKSGVAAKDITNLIKSSVEQVDKGARIADQSGAILVEIVRSVKKVSDLNSEIATASQEQAGGLDQVAKAVNQLDKITQGNASSAEETAASAEEMSAQSISLHEIIRQLIAIVQKENSSQMEIQPSYNPRQDKRVTTAEERTHKINVAANANKAKTSRPKLVINNSQAGDRLQSDHVVHAAGTIPLTAQEEEKANKMVANLDGF